PVPQEHAQLPIRPRHPVEERPEGSARGIGGHASAAIAAGVDPKVVQKMLGHASAAMTLDVYGHLWPSRLGEVADAMETARNSALRAPNPAPPTPPGPALGM
ncbi:MAG: hypothetical protein LBD77_09185, partial [Bifidobacteriaceae bacterium]|nr:hypothetical protein [Bifidobacteriaceae bacterium]